VHGKLRKINFPLGAVKILLALCAAGVLTIAALASTYARMLFRVANYNSLRQEREALNDRCRHLESAARQSGDQLGSLESLGAELGLAHGFGDPRRSRFAPTLLAAVAEDQSALGPGYAASLYTFHLLRARSPRPFAAAIDRSLFPDLPSGNSTTPSIWPVRGEITAGFGQRMDPFTGEDEFHGGVDIVAPAGAPVHAAADGILFHAGPDRGYGNEVLIDHGFGFATKYGHLDRVYAWIGEQVKRGQVIGTVGMTGRATGPHLHYEVLFRDVRVNPVSYLHR
jgi:murein DD-endopeptidase MepM/ murein hydrolase activator NlpD